MNTIVPKLMFCSTLVIAIIFCGNSVMCRSSVSNDLSLLSADESKADATKLFEGYPKSEAFDNYVRSHLDSKSHLKRNDIVYATWFLDGRTNVAMQSITDAKGKVFQYRDVYD